MAPLGIGFLKPVVSKNASVVASASSSSSPHRGAVHRLAAFQAGPEYAHEELLAALSNIGGGCSEKSDLSISAQLWPDWL